MTDPRKPRLYLAGPINQATDSEAIDWRERVKADLSDRYDFIDPMARDFRGIEGDHVAEIVEGDKADIRKTDAVLANCPRPSAGTSMEIFYAHSLAIPVIVVVHPPASPWITYHAAEIHDTLDAAIDSLGWRWAVRLISEIAIR